MLAADNDFGRDVGSERPAGARPTPSSFMDARFDVLSRSAGLFRP